MKVAISKISVFLVFCVTLDTKQCQKVAPDE